MSTVTVTVPEPERFDQEDAEECVHLVRDTGTGHVSAIYVDLNDPFLNVDGARAIALRLLSLADELDRVQGDQLRRQAAPVLRALPKIGGAR